ncbi:LacI family DNA-binding transcriptional regulator [Brenneria populi]|uniref:LacI family DNA-binding transcriptional regulator n=2 Tax=Brenneria populi TaxID=1505588 RepID=A0ABU6JP82_9GAMM|nr:LacI family DNA-binding transcriptional regulator [Brenneria populi Li et al. 2015]
MARPLASIRMADIAKAAGVSPMTVSNSFRNPDLVKKNTRQKVLETAAAMGYVPNTMAGNFVSGQSKVVAVVTPSVRYSSFADMIITLEQTLSAAGYHLIISLVESPEREPETLRALVGRRVDGIVIAGELQDPNARELIVKSGMPMVETWDLHDDMTDMGVGFSEHDAAVMATEHLIEAGRKRIGMIGLNLLQHRRLRERLRGFRTAMKQAGWDDSLVALVPEQNDYGAGAAGLRSLIAQSPDLDGIFCMTDILAVGALFECQRLGLSVPRRLSVMGYGDYDIAPQIPPGLSTIHTPGDEIGRAAATLLLNRLDRRPDAKRFHRVNYHLVYRCSVIF